MKCFTHNSSDAVAVCVHCGRAVCTPCATPSPSGRVVCSPGCAAASKKAEDLIESTRNKSARGARVTAYFCFGLGIIFLIGAVFFHIDLKAWPLTLFVFLAGIGMVIGGAGYMRVAKRNSESGTA